MGAASLLGTGSWVGQDPHLPIRHSQPTGGQGLKDLAKHQNPQEYVKMRYLGLQSRPTASEPREGSRNLDVEHSYLVLHQHSQG